MELLLDNQSLNNSEFYHVVQPIVNLVEKESMDLSFCFDQSKSKILKNYLAWLRKIIN